LAERQRRRDFFQEGRAMKKKAILPAISVGLLVTAREVPAGTIDLGVVAERLTIEAGLTLNANTIGGFTINALQFVAGNTIDSLLTQLLGPQNPGSMSFDVMGSEGASGMATFTGSYIDVGGEVTLNPVPVSATITRCTSALPAVQTGCTVGNTFTANPYDAVGVIQSMEAAQILSVPPGFGDGSGTLPHSLTITLPLGFDSNNNAIQGEEIETAIGTPEPASWSLAALGAALAGWWRRRSGRK
jgi:hypothetical protein